MMSVLKLLLGSVLSSLLGYMKQRRQEENLKRLGFAEAQVKRHSANKRAIRMANRVRSDPSGDLSRLGAPDV